MTRTTSTRPCSDLEKAYTTFVQLLEVAGNTLDLDNRITLAEAFDEFTRHGLVQVATLCPAELAQPEDLVVALDGLARLLGRLNADATGLPDALRYTRALDLIRTVHRPPGVAASGTAGPVWS